MNTHNFPKNLRYVQLVKPNGQAEVIKNPNYDPNYSEPELSNSSEEEMDEEYQDEEEEKRWCLHVNNYCPQNSGCVYWIEDESEDEDEDEESFGDCLKLKLERSKMEAEIAKANFYKNASKMTLSIIKGSEKTAVGALIRKGIDFLSLAELEEENIEDLLVNSKITEVKKNKGERKPVIHVKESEPNNVEVDLDNALDSMDSKES